MAQILIIDDDPRICAMLSYLILEQGHEPQAAHTLEDGLRKNRDQAMDVVLLDNFSFDDLRRGVELRDSLGLAGKVRLEASGGVKLDTVRAIAETGVDCISVGAITHSAPALDLALEAV
jgi:nicotinate-nucleotide pyrophosphorylase (carboxylating)